MIPLLLSLVIAPGCTSVDADRITGQDLIKAVPAFAGLPSSLVIGFAPQPGSRRVFAPGDLTRIGGENGLSISIANPVCFERALIQVDSTSVLEAMRASLNNPDALIEVLEISKQFVPPGPLVFPIDSLPQHATANVAVWNGYVESFGRRYPVWARVRILVAQTRIVAVAEIRPGQTLVAGDVRAEQTNAFPERSPSFKATAECVGQAARHFVAAGSPIRASDLMIPGDVERGDTVAVEVKIGRATLVLAAQSDGQGVRGQLIALKNPSTGKTFRARVVGRDKASIDWISPEVLP